MGQEKVTPATAARWERVRDLLNRELTDAGDGDLLDDLSLVDVRPDSVVLGVPSRFLRHWVLENYADRIRDLWAADDPDVSTVNVVVAPRRRINGHGQHLEAANADPARTAAPPRPAARAAGPADSSGAPLDPRCTFDNFVIGKSNEFAYAAARRVADSDLVPFNPLFLYSGSGLGKTHLMHAIGWHLRQRDPDRRVVYMSAERFMFRFIRALRDHDMMVFKEEFRSVDVMMIDDVQFIAGKDNTQEEFFHTFNALVDQGRQIVISADKSPSDLDGIEDRLKTRLNCGLVADIHPTSFELRLGILQAKVERLGAQVPPKVLEFLAHRITTNVRELEGALNRVVQHNDLVGRTITLETTQELVQDLLRANERRVSIEDIQKKVAEHFNIRITEMRSSRRAISVARPRQIAMYLSKQLTTAALPEIGRKFGDRDHTTVIHAVKRVQELMKKDPDLAENVELLLRTLST